MIFTPINRPRESKNLTTTTWQAAQIPKQDASTKLRRLSEMFPTKPNHLKRAKPQENSLLILLAPLVEFQQHQTELLAEMQTYGVTENNLVAVQVSSQEPESIEEQQQMARTWPCTFHPKPVVELDLTTKAQVTKVLEQEHARIKEDQDSYKTKECSMVACILEETTDYQRFASKLESCFDHAILAMIRSISATTEGYLCTGRTVVLINEPCILCAMALVHSRTKQVFVYGHASADSPFFQHNLNTISSLNHRFPVYHVEDSECIEKSQEVQP
ncbi:tRNA-specific adenosine deaminase 3 [Nematocida homosporus]|uniref:tRNA-specific adenosine deaminase 3 n=1 Tax=Nematocida homosporus TaxID=1912981 RepID=UPI00221E480B|nr:tRNA-specific adenosine deaminase 3 [Nematocida homosporus]KAI5185767.1 tRNA-specific adenosine deaminase 3 [Nematocida homosporus]